MLVYLLLPVYPVLVEGGRVGRHLGVVARLQAKPFLVLNKHEK